MKKLLSLLCLAGVVCVMAGCGGGIKATANTDKKGPADTHSGAPASSK